MIVAVKWISKENNFGEKKNEVRLTNIENPADYDETSTVDNESSATTLVVVKTGDDNVIIMMFAGAVVIIGICMVLAFRKRD